MAESGRDARLAGFGERLRHLRRAAGLSQEALAAAAGLDRTYVGGIERGERNVALLNVYKLAQALKIHPSRLFTDGQNGELP